MKRTSICLILTIISLFRIQGQNYEPTTRWPYLYEHFQKGSVYLDNGTVVEREVNIHLVKSVLHYVDENGQILELTNAGDVDSVRTATATYVFIGDVVYRALKQTDVENGLYLLSVGNFDDLFTTTGAYGVKSHTSAASNYAALDFGGITERNFIKLSSEKDSGKYFPIKETYYFKIGGKLIKAGKKDLEKELESASAKERLQQYLKKNKVKWNRADSLQELLAALTAP
jgi:hypothetical protein